jgi:hypothetical protein
MAKLLKEGTNLFVNLDQVTKAVTERFTLFNKFIDTLKEKIKDYTTSLLKLRIAEKTANQIDKQKLDANIKILPDNIVTANPSNNFFYYPVFLKNPLE